MSNDTCQAAAAATRRTCNCFARVVPALRNWLVTGVMCLLELPLKLVPFPPNVEKVDSTRGQHTRIVRSVMMSNLSRLHLTAEGTAQSVEREDGEVFLRLSESFSICFKFFNSSILQVFCQVTQKSLGKLGNSNSQQRHDFSSTAACRETRQSEAERSVRSIAR